jgi:seryl-tRNA synthetase
MLDKRFIRENPEKVKEAVRVKGIDLDVDELLDLDQHVRKLQHELDQKQALRKSSASGTVGADEARRAYLRNLNTEVKALREELAETRRSCRGCCC